MIMAPKFKARKAMVKSLDFFELGWIVGFLEGEGSFMLTKTAKYPAPLVVAVQVEIEPVLKLYNWFGGALNHRERKDPNHNDIWRWQIYGQKAAFVMRLVEPYMTAKRQKAIARALDAYKPIYKPKFIFD